MDGEQFENRPCKNRSETVTAVGNSWVICRSKSYSGRVYYFNTLTGEAAWNLSDAEVEKAKSRTNHLETQQGVCIEGCPEPPEPPMDHSNESTLQHRQSQMNQQPSRIYNKQIINNQFPKQPFATITPFAAQPCTHVVSPLPMGVATPTYNPNIWAIPPNHQIFIAPTVSSLVNQSQAAVGIAFDNQNHSLSVQNTALPLSSRFQKIYDRPPETSPTKCFHKHYNPRANYHQYGYRNRPSHFSSNNFRKNRIKNDLRQVLSAKKNCQDEIKVKNKLFMVHKNQGSCSQSISKPVHYDDQTNTDGDWLEENIHVIGTKLNLDVTNLKNLANENAIKDCWYIAADKDILLNHLNFLNILINSDEKCHLMVPQEVVAELNAIVEVGTGATRDLSRAQRAINFLSQQLDAGCAIIGDDSSDTNDFGDAFILNSCLDLAEQNYHVVLLSNNQSLIEFKNSIGISIFSMNEMKQFLSSPFKAPNPQITSSENSANVIKITIPNDLLRTPKGNRTANSEKQVEKLSHEQCDIVKTKISLDASVQTELNHLQSETIEVKSVTSNESQSHLCKKADRSPNNNSTNSDKSDDKTGKAPLKRREEVKSVTSNESQSDLCKNADRSSNNNLTNSDKSDDNTGKTPLKRREIRLKRSTSNPTYLTSENNVDKKDTPNRMSATSENNMDKKQFKWRRRRNVRSNQSFGPVQSSANKSDCIANVEDSVLCKINNMSAPTSVEPCHQSNESVNKVNEVSQEDNIDSSDAGSCVVQRNICERIIIEETSTSGIISNTSIDSDTESSKLHNIKVNFDKNEKPESSQILMFEVTDKLMEDYLKLRCDEWVSRFVQIMEEVLTQVLQRDPQFQHSNMPPPWTLNEAAKCIKFKFNKNDEVQNAANQLNDILLKTSDERGGINIHMTPQEFMEMYSYGVHLVDRLESAVENCEDLHTASDSLSKLLSDIQNPHLDTSHNDTFGDIHDAIGNITQIEERSDTNTTNRNLTPNTSEKELPKEQEPNINDNVSTDSYNLRSKKRKIEKTKEQENQTVKFIRNIDIEMDFFDSLHLQKINNVGGTVKQIINNSKVCISEETAKDENANKSNTEPKIERNFIKFPEFEKRLEHISTRESLDSDQFDCMDDADYYSDEYYDSGEELEDAASYAPDNLCSKTESPKHSSEVTNNYHWIFRKQLQSIKDAFLRVNLFCEETLKELSSTEVSNNRKIEIRDKAQMAYLQIKNLRLCLNRICFRETYDLENNTQSVLKKEGIDDFDDTQFRLYRAIISRCEDQANILLEGVECILSTVQNCI